MLVRAHPVPLPKVQLSVSGLFLEALAEDLAALEHANN